MSARVFVGWDVGGWNCDKNPSSRDALVLLDDQRRPLGRPWRGNLRAVFNEAMTGAELVEAVFDLCQVETAIGERPTLLFAIDTPLGFSTPFIDLVVHGRAVDTLGAASDNPYLHRKTEHFLFQRGLSPLSPLKDMIGSQATKGLHFLARYAPQVERCGVWSDGQGLTAIEAYPSACKRSAYIETLRAPFRTARKATHTEALPVHQDIDDALTCALIGWTFHHAPDRLAQPDASIDPREGWIFVPLDGLR